MAKKKASPRKGYKRSRCPICGNLVAENAMRQHVNRHPMEATPPKEDDLRTTQARPVLISHLEVVMTPEETLDCIVALGLLGQASTKIQKQRTALGTIAILAAHAHSAIPSGKDEQDQ